eukprot:1047014-Rhodomonas_salina.2
MEDGVLLSRGERRLLREARRVMWCSCEKAASERERERERRRRRMMWGIHEGGHREKLAMMLCDVHKGQHRHRMTGGVDV